MTEGPDSILGQVTDLIFVDVETSGLDPEKDFLLEVAMARWSIPWRSLVWSQSILLQTPDSFTENSAFHINGISPGLTMRGLPRNELLGELLPHSDQCLLVAHNVDFDSKWLPEWQDYRWICSCDDFEYPRPTGSRALTQIALAHGVGVVSAHRAIDDVLTLMRLFERVAEIDDNGSYLFKRRIAMCLRPKARFVVADRSFDADRNKLVKSHRFRWDPDERVWWRKMFIEDAPMLPFEVEQVPPADP